MSTQLEEDLGGTIEEALPSALFRVKLDEQDGGDLSTVGDLLALVERRVIEVREATERGTAS